MQEFFLKIGQRLSSFRTPVTMGILNVTPDSFAVHCADCSKETILTAAQSLLQQGATILDIGGCSTRPGAALISEDEEWERVSTALSVIRSAFPSAVLSLDTWRSGIAARAIAEFGDMIINDVSGGQWDAEMFPLLSRARVPYILTHTGWADMQQHLLPRKYPTDILAEVLDFLQSRLDTLRQMGAGDIILDPGFGLGKTVEESYLLLQHLDLFQVLHCPVLAGLSRKSMFFKPLGITPQQALNATTAANAIALERGAQILRVHDVKEAQETIQIHCLTHHLS